MTVIFKVCSCCDKQWNTEEDFRNDCEYLADWQEAGLLLFNCKCRSTLAIEIYKGSKEEATKKRREAKNGHK